VQIAPDRVFSLERARLLDWILPTVQNPATRLADRGDKLYYIGTIALNIREREP